MTPELKDVLIAAIPSIIPTVMVGFGILVNKSDITRISGEILTLRSEVHADMSAFRAEVQADMNAMGTSSMRILIS